MDAVIAMPDGKWCGFEIKLGANQIDMAAENLIKIKNERKKIYEKIIYIRKCNRRASRQIM